MVVMAIELPLDCRQWQLMPIDYYLQPLSRKPTQKWGRGLMQGCASAGVGIGIGWGKKSSIENKHDIQMLKFSELQNTEFPFYAFERC